MKSKLIRIGEEYSVRIPKSYVKRAGLGESFHILVQGNSIILRSNKNPRAGWEEQIKKAIAEHGNDLSEEDIEWMNAPMGPILPTPKRKRAATRPRRVRS